MSDRDKFLLATIVLSLGIDQEKKPIDACKICGCEFKRSTGECDWCGCYLCATCHKLHLGDPASPCPGNGVDPP